MTASSASIRTWRTCISGSCGCSVRPPEAPRMIREFFRFELREQLRSPLLWFLAVLFALLGFGPAASDAVQLGGGIGNVHRNAPIVVAQWLTMFSLLGMLIVPIFISGALLRDFEQGTAELFFASPIRRRDYLLGRLAAAMLASALV